MKIKFVGFYNRCSSNVCLRAFLSLIGLLVLSSTSNVFADEGASFDSTSKVTFIYSGLTVNSTTVTPTDFTYTVSGGTITIRKYTGTGGNVAIPATIDGLPVVGIGNSAFYKCTSLTSVTIPDSVTSIGGEAFGDCSSLTSIVVDPNNRVYSSQDGVLYDKAITVIIKYPCGKSGGFTIPSSITSIGNYAFYNCTSLTSVTIPDSVTSIGNSAFKGCASLTSVTILNSVVIDNEFDGCTSLTNVTIGNGVTSIGNYAFYNCTSLTSAYFLGNAPEMGQSVFRGCSSSFVVCFTAGSTGFTPPSWDGYPAAVCEEPTSSTTTVPSTTSTIQSTTTTTVPANLCAAEAIYGSNSEETELLRRYRDKVLSKSASGRQMIKTYYELSPAVAEVLQNNEAARENARKVLDSLMPAIREKVKQ